MKVLTNRSAWQGFLRRAKVNHPREHVEAIWGHQMVDTFRVVKFSRIRLQKGAPNTEWELKYTTRETLRQKKLAKEAGLEFLGTVHTHPLEEQEPAPSETDHYDAFKDGERVMGIVNLVKPKAKNSHFKYTVRWWIPQKPISFEVLPE